MKLTLNIIFSLFLVLIMVSVVQAQPPGLPSAPSQAPIDGGLSILAAAGGVYAVRKLRHSRKERSERED